MIETISIPKRNADYLKKSIEKINKKARKFGCDELKLTIVDNGAVYKTDECPYTGRILLSPIVIEMVEATLEYEIPKIDGWELVAKLDIYPSENEDVVMVSPVPDTYVPPEYQNATSIKCDHCGWNRNRHHSVLLKHTETGEYKEVGSSCVKDFFGHDPRGFMLMAGIKFSSLVEGTYSEKLGGRRIWSYELIDVLRYSSASVTKWGWRSRKVAYEYGGEATSDHVWDNLEPWPKMPESAKVQVGEEDVELAEKILAYFKELDPGDNDYLLNLVKLTKLGYVPAKMMGYACSMIKAYEKAMAREEKIKEREEKEKGMPKSEHVGSVGERLRGIRVEVLFVKHLETDFGESTLYTFRDALGNVYKTFYSGYSWSAEKEDVLIMDGTVKKHAEWMGKKETMLNRVSVKEAPEEAITVEEFSV